MIGDLIDMTAMTMTRDSTIGLGAVDSRLDGNDSQTAVYPFNDASRNRPMAFLSTARREANDPIGCLHDASGYHDALRMSIYIKNNQPYIRCSCYRNPEVIRS